MTYAFTFDASACSGCKACQIACKDKNQLPVGVLWRRVYEVSGGTWKQYGNAWVNNIFAYNLSIACNHCVHPKCAGVCPTDAYVQRDDGIVYIDVSRCIGCGYCNWACPYHVPQYNPGLGCMTKCDFCADLIDEGGSPACVTSCQMRVLHFGDIEVLRAQYGTNDDIYPLPPPNLTKPALVLTCHPDSVWGIDQGARIGNWEEI